MISRLANRMTLVQAGPSPGDTSKTENKGTHENYSHKRQQKITSYVTSNNQSDRCTTRASSRNMIGGNDTKEHDSINRKTNDGNKTPMNAPSPKVGGKGAKHKGKKKKHGR